MMSDFVFKHHRDTQNLGDAVCSPFDYYPEFEARGCAVDLAQPTPAVQSVIYGGGKIMGGLPNSLAAMIGLHGIVSLGVSARCKNSRSR